MNEVDRRPRMPACRDGDTRSWRLRATDGAIPGCESVDILGTASRGGTGAVANVWSIHEAT